MALKHFVLLTTFGVIVSNTAFAQSSVTLYGIVDQSVRYTTNVDAANDGSLQMTNGAITNSRWGLKGSEDLGSGMQAIFRLESGFEPESGALDSKNMIFNRYAYVGLTGAFGTFKLGRQATVGMDLFGDLDPLTVGNYAANSWPYYLTQGYVSSAVTYEKSLSGFTFAATYGFGGQAGSMGADSYWGIRSSYTQGPVMVGAVYQQTRDIASRSQQMWGVAAKYTIGPASLFLGYIGGTDATGMIDDYANAQTVKTGSYTDNPRQDAIGYTGIVYQVNPAVCITGALYYDSMRNVNGLADNTGKRYTGVIEAEYALSKSTQVYGTVDFSKVSGGAVTQLPGSNSNQTGMAVGLRHMF